MKTKNIFRMLLVAAALLMGANNVKAGVDGQIWPANGADNTTSQCSIDKQIFINANITAGQYIRVYLGTITGDGGYWQMGFKANGADPKFEEFPGQNWGVQTISSQMNVSISSGYIDLKCSENTVTKLKSGGFTIDANGIILKNVAIVGGSSSGGSSTSTDTPVWTGNQWLNNWNYYTLPSGTFSSLKCDGTDVIRIYGNLGNLGTTTDEGKTILYGIELVADWGDSSKKTKHTGTDNFTAGYYDFTNVSSTLANALKSTGIINGYNFYVTSIVINPTNTSTVTTPTLSFPQDNYSANYGGSFTSPTLTSSVDGLTISYSSSNTGVATVDASTGAVTIVGIGSTVITATSAAVESTYNSATASYTLTVSKGTATISNAGISLTFGSSFTAPTTNPANLALTYSNSTNTNVAVIDGNGNVVPVGAGTTSITASFAGNDLYNSASTTFQLTVNAPTREGAVWNGAGWLGNYTLDDVGTHPSIPTTNLKSAKVGDVIRFYGKLGPLSATDWRCEVHGNPWSNQLGDPSGNDAFANGYFDLPITADNIGMLSADNLTLNGYNLTITAVELIPSDAPAKQDVTLTFSPSTATATMGEAFTAPTPTATANGETVTGLSISYSSSNTSVATVNASTGAVTLVAPGTTTITASFSGNDNYNAATASYTLTVNAAAEYVNVDDTKIGENGYRTYVTWCAVDLSRSVNVEAYYATGLNSAGTEVEFTQVTGVCASGVPLLLKATVTDASEYKLLKSSAAGTTPTDNKLQAGQGNEVSGDDKYVLTKHSGQVVFAEVNIVGAIVGTEYAYLDLNGSNARGRLSIRLNGESTGISTIQNDERNLDGTIYNLRGQRVENPTKGLYIINGKKVVIK